MPLQRNTTDHPLDVWAASATVQPGDTIDWPDPVIGFELVEPEPAATPPDTPATPAVEPSPPKTTRKAAKPAGEGSATT
jgi:hypothetical protein